MIFFFSFFSGFDGGSDDDTDDEELMKALEENVEIAKKVGECPVQHTERIKYKLIEKGAFFIILWFFWRFLIARSIQRQSWGFQPECENLLYLLDMCSKVYKIHF